MKFAPIYLRNLKIYLYRPKSSYKLPFGYVELC